MPAYKGEELRRKCFDCDGQMQGRRENYRYTECGLNSVVLQNVVVYHCGKCGAIVPEIPAMENLHTHIALSILEKRSVISPEEIRFVRKIAGYSATTLAKVMGVSKEALSRWENGRKKIGNEAERLLRFACFFAILKQSGPPSADGDLSDAMEVVRRMKDINLPEVLQRMDERTEDPSDSSRRDVVINPELLRQYGTSTSYVAPGVQSRVQ